MRALGSLAFAVNLAASAQADMIVTDFDSTNPGPEMPLTDGYQSGWGTPLGATGAGDTMAGWTWYTANSTVNTISVPYDGGTATVGEQAIRDGVAGGEINFAGSPTSRFNLRWGIWEPDLNRKDATALRRTFSGVEAGTANVAWQHNTLGGFFAYHSQSGGTTWTSLDNGADFPVVAGNLDVLFIANDGVDTAGGGNEGLQSVTVTLTGGDSGFALTITPATAPDTGFDLEWDSQAGKLYNVRTSTDLVGAIADWDPVAGGENLEATPPANTFNVDPADARRFFAVEEFDAPPLLSEDFETGDGGFTVATVEGTGWERGAPDSSGPGGTVDVGNDGSANAWATNLGTFSFAGDSPTAIEKGFFIDRTEAALRSPVIDLTEAAGAELTFDEALDFPDTDFAVVNLINANTDDIIAQVHVSEDPVITDDATWNNVGPIDLAAGLGQQVRIEWRFTGTGGGTSDFLGWYIDNVVVTEATS